MAAKGAARTKAVAKRKSVATKGKSVLGKCAQAAAKKLRQLVRRKPKVTIGPCKSTTPLLPRASWKYMPPWIALYAERGPGYRCWEGHALKSEQQDLRRHRSCVWCNEKSAKKSFVMACRQCNWVVCEGCKSRKRLPRLKEDPLFHGPGQPRLLPPANQPASSKGTVIICPGGNYEYLVPGEGLPMAELLAAQGIRALVLRYRLLPKYDLNDMLNDLTAATALVRKTYGGPVAALGFSAGGHLVASLSLKTKLKAGKKGGSSPFDAQALIYPCIDGSDWAHPEWCGFSNWDECFPVSRTSMLQNKEALLGGAGFAAPPTFMVASTGDEASPPKDHTDKYAKALRKNGIGCKYLLKDFGAHGFGILEGPEGWTKQCVDWLQKQGFGSA